MKIGSFTMARNEASILDPFCDQLTALIDVPVLLDHESTDETAQIFRDRVPAGGLFRLRSTGYPQAEVANFFARYIFGQLDADYLFFLDCDEYLPFQSKEALLSALPESGYGELRWRNCHFESADLSDPFHGRIVSLRNLSAFPKVSFSRRFMEQNPNLTVTQGYHSLIGLAGQYTATPLSPIGLLHFPVPFREKYITKVISSSSTIRNNEYLAANRLGMHWINHADAIEGIDLEDRQLRSIALNYPNIGSTSEKDIVALDFPFDHIKSGFAGSRLVEGNGREPSAVKPNQDFRILDESSRQLFESNPKSGAVIHGACVASVTRGARAMQKVDISTIDFEDLQDRWVAPLFSLPQKLPLTAWHGHIPFLFALFRNLRPRSFVELGVHYGASLIAAATAAQAYDAGTKIIGVDTWAGDEHAGHYDGGQIYADLASFVGRTFRDVTLLRTTFDDACASMANGSLDMVHIDGLHTYEAVRHDFETWLPKMSDRGVVLFHDIAVRERGFGVWRFWQEISQNYPSLEYTHCHGLGVLFTGTRGPGDAFLEQLCANESLFSAYRATVSQIAELLPLRSAYLAADDHPVEPVARAAASSTDADTEALRAELRNTQWALQHYRNQYQTLSHHYESSTSWRVTKPLRYLKRLIG